MYLYVNKFWAYGCIKHERKKNCNSVSKIDYWRITATFWNFRIWILWMWSIGRQALWNGSFATWLEKRDLFYKDIKAPNGVTRAIIFAQKASTLRGTEPKAYVALLRRFYVDYRFDNDDRFYEVIVGDNERKVVLRKWSVGNSKYNSPEFKKAIKEAREFLDKKYPNWNDHLTYLSEWKKPW